MQTLSGENSHNEVLDLGFPAEVANLQGPEELGTFMQNLQDMFGEEDGSGCHHHHQHKDQVTENCREVDYNNYNGPRCGKLSIAFPPGKQY